MLLRPKRLSTSPNWHGHLPFGLWLVHTLRPHLIVELGVLQGDSYCTFCQATQAAGLESQCFGVAIWSNTFMVWITGLKQPRSVSSGESVTLRSVPQMVPKRIVFRCIIGPTQRFRGLETWNPVASIYEVISPLSWFRCLCGCL